MKKNTVIVLIINTFLIAYIIGIYFAGIDSFIFELRVNIAAVLALMFALELLSTLSFQLRIKLSARYELNHSSRLRGIIPTIAGMSGLIAGFEGVLLINNTNTFLDFIIKIPPVFSATFLGVFLNLSRPKCRKTMSEI